MMSDLYAAIEDLHAGRPLDEIQIELVRTYLDHLQKTA